MSQRNQRRADRRRSREERSTAGPEPFAVDVAERGDEYHVSVEVPGVGKQDLDVSVDDDRLQVVADYGDDEGAGRVLRQERERGVARRVIRLPGPVDEKHVSATYREGVVFLTLKKRDEPKRVEIE